MKVRQHSHKLSREEHPLLARVAAVLAGEYGEELKEKLRRWITVFFRYRQLKEKGFDVRLVSPRPGIQLIRVNGKIQSEITTQDVPFFRSQVLRYLFDTRSRLLSKGSMELRNHPIMNYRGIPNWPPVWTNGKQSSGVKTKKGEIGVLKFVMVHKQMPNRLFLFIDHEGETYTGCLLFNDGSFCRQLELILEKQIGASIKEIGNLDLSYTL